MGLTLFFSFVLGVFAAPGYAQSPTFEDEVAEIVNEERLAFSLPPLKRSSALDQAAETHSSNMAGRDFFAHCDPDNNSLPWDRMAQAGYSGYAYAAENIAAGYPSPTAAMVGWMNSNGHRNNILSSTVREIGVGHFYQTGDQGTVRLDQNGDCNADSYNHGPYRHYWTQNFGRINSIYPVVINREQFETEDAVVQLYLYGSGTMDEMRFRNESGSWSSWQSFAPNATWTLSAGNGTKTVHAELKNGSTVYSVSDQIVLSGQALVAVPDPGVANGLTLFPAFPNPSQGAAQLSFEMEEAGRVQLDVFDVRGRRVAALLDEERQAGYQNVQWNGRDNRGQTVTPGVYFVSLRAGSAILRTKLIVRP